MDQATRNILRGKMNDALTDAAKIAYVLDMDSTDFANLASEAFKAATKGVVAPRGRYMPPRDRTPGRVKKVWCPHCRRWTDRVEIDIATGAKVHGGIRGCGRPVQFPDEDGMVPAPVDDEGEGEEEDSGNE
jgi:hypothetical protein